MKYAVVSSSQLTRFNRWDAGFHLLFQEYGDRAEALSVTMEEAEVLDLLADSNSIPKQLLEFLAPLTRGSQIKTPSREQLFGAVKEYPFLSLAIVMDKAPGLLEARKLELAQQIKKLDSVIQRLSKATQILESKTPAIKDLLSIPQDVQKALSENRFVAGVAYLDDNTLSIPVETSPTAYVADCWVIELEDWTGAEMIDKMVSEGEVPVPRRYEDLGNPIGYMKDLADHTVNYGMGWRR